MDDNPVESMAWDEGTSPEMGPVAKTRRLAEVLRGELDTPGINFEEGEEAALDNRPASNNISSPPDIPDNSEVLH